MILAHEYLGRYGSSFDAYMALQRALMSRYISRGGTMEGWCERLAPRFRQRYEAVFMGASCSSS